MHSYLTDPEPLSLSAQRALETDLAAQPVIALLYQFSGAIMELLGPMFWAALILFFIEIELDAFR